MKVDDEIKLLLPHVFYDFENAKDGKRFEAIAQSDAIHDQCFIRKTGQSDNFSARLSHRHRDPRARKPFSNSAQRRQTQHDIAELAKINHQDVARIKHLLSLKFCSQKIRFIVNALSLS